MRITLSIEMLMVNICYKSKGFVAGRWWAPIYKTLVAKVQTPLMEMVRI